MGRGESEHDLQCRLVRWYNIARRGKGICFAVPNGGQRNAIVAAKLRSEGVMRGVSDLIVVEPGGVMFVEVKTPRGVVSGYQKAFAEIVSDMGYRYDIVRSLDDFAKLFNK